VHSGRLIFGYKLVGRFKQKFGGVKLNEVYALFDWTIEKNHLVDQHFVKFLEAADELYCGVWVDWWLEFSARNVRRLVLRAPSTTALQELVDNAGTHLALTAWTEVTQEYFLTVTKDGQVPALQATRRNDIEYFNKLLGGFHMSIYLDEK
jgi:hypothetical protein